LPTIILFTMNTLYSLLSLFLLLASVVGEDQWADHWTPPHETNVDSAPTGTNEIDAK
jgi:hypothetical protein